MRYIGSIILFFGFISLTHAQENPGFRGWMTYFEVNSVGKYDYSVNGGHFLGHWNDFYFYGYGGFGIATTTQRGGYGVDKHLFWQIPFGAGIVKGRGRNHIELATGLSYQRGRYESSVTPSKTLYFVPQIGYRFQRPNGRFIFRMLYTPIYRVKEFSNIDIYRPTPYVLKHNETKRFSWSFGYYFGKRS